MAPQPGPSSLFPLINLVVHDHILKRKSGITLGGQTVHGGHLLVGSP